MTSQPTPKLKALILDDLPSRHSLIKKTFPQYDFHSSLDIWDAQKAITESPFGVLFVDFDLCDFSDASAIVTENSRVCLTGADFLTFMFTSVPQEHLPSKVIIVSIDKEGAHEMMFMLKNCGITDFSWEPLPN